MQHSQGNLPIRQDVGHRLWDKRRETSLQGSPKFPDQIQAENCSIHG